MGRLRSHTPWGWNMARRVPSTMSVTYVKSRTALPSPEWHTKTHWENIFWPKTLTCYHFLNFDPTEQLHIQYKEKRTVAVDLEAAGDEIDELQGRHVRPAGGACLCSSRGGTGVFTKKPTRNHEGGGSGRQRGKQTSNPPYPGTRPGGPVGGGGLASF